jgi:hypothetical protein
LFALLAAEIGVPKVTPQNLAVRDSLEWFQSGQMPTFDAVLNNPPWGELKSVSDRQRVQRFFSTSYAPETYVAFSELAIRRLNPGGFYGLVLPTQAMTAQNSSRLRQLIIRDTNLEGVLVLPHAAFADATVRGLVALGRAKDANASPKRVYVTRYALVKRLETDEPVQTLTLSRSSLERTGHSPWTKILHGKNRSPARVPTVKLSEVALVCGGVELYHQGRGNPAQTAEVVRTRPFSFPTKTAGTVPAVRGRQVIDYRLLPCREFIQLGSWLAAVGPHESLMRMERVFVREICRRDGRLNAAIAKRGVVPLKSVLTVVPEHIDAHLITAILNSQIAADYVRANTVSFSKIDFQKITIGELRKLAIPIAALDAVSRRTHSLPPPMRRETGLRVRIRNAVRRLIQSGAADTRESRKLRDHIETLIAQLYGYQNVPQGS